MVKSETEFVPSPEPCRADSGVDGVQCDKPVGHSGSHAGSRDGGTILWSGDDEADEPDGAIKTTVNGEEATIVLDGATGEVKGADQVMSDAAFAKPPLDDLIRTLTRAHDDLIDAEAEKKSASERHKKAQAFHNAVADNIVRHYGHGATTLTFAEAAPDVDAAAEEEADEDTEGDEE